jgi:hypothetical protein
MNDCHRIRESLGPWLDGELGEPDAEGIRVHLESCAPCDRERRQLEKLHASLRTFWLSDVPQVAFEPFWDGVRGRIIGERSRREALWEWVRSRLTEPGFAWAMAAVVLALLGVLSWDLFWRLGPPANSFTAVESIDAYGRNVALLREDETKTTVIWLYQNQEGEDESPGTNTENSHSF